MTGSYLLPTHRWGADRIFCLLPYCKIGMLKIGQTSFVGDVGPLWVNREAK